MLRIRSYGPRMFDAVTQTRMQRSEGRAQIALDGGRLAALYQSGSAKVMLPRVHTATPEIVFLNTSGGLTSDDRIDYQVTLGPDTRAVATTQTAERAYRAPEGPARASVSLQVGDGGALAWLPQETILFDGAKLYRETQVELSGSASFVGLETVILGRGAMGEKLKKLDLTDRRTIRRDGRLVCLDIFRMDDDALKAGSGHALLASAKAVSVLIFCAADAESRKDQISAALTEADVDAAASALPGRLVVRAVAQDAWPLRRQMARIMDIICPGMLPRVWQY